MEADRRQAIAESHLPTPCTVSSVAPTADGQGGFTKPETVKETTVCRITAGGSVSDMSAPVADKLQGREAYRYKLPYASSVAVGDIITAVGQSFEVLSRSKSPEGTLTLGWCV